MGDAWCLGGLVLALLAIATIAAAQVPAPQIPHSSLMSGRVEDTVGNPVSEVNLELTTEDGMLVSVGMTDALGNFSLPLGQAQGPFEISVNLPGQTVIESITTPNLAMVVIRVPAGSGLRHRGPISASVSLNDLEVSPKARSKLAAAAKAMAKSDSNQAMKLVNEALALAPNWSRAHYMRGVLYMDRSQWSEARTDLDAAVQADPRNALAFIAQARLELALNHPDLSANDLHHALTISPTMWEAHYALAALDLQQGNYAEAKTFALAAATDLPAGPPNCHLVAAMAAEALHQNDAAIIQYRAFLAQTPDLKQADAVRARQRLDVLQAEGR